MKDKQRREELINSGKAQRYMHTRKYYMTEETYIEQYLGSDGHIHNGLKSKKYNRWCNTRPDDPEFFGVENEDDLRILENIRHAQIQQTQKVKLHLQYMFATKHPCYFMTFTFKEEKINEHPKKLKHWITTLLNQITEDYLINIDYGDETERLHFHAVIQLSPESYIITNKTKQNHKLNIFEKYESIMGFYYAQPIRKTGASIKRLTRYLNKLTFHSTKVKQEYISTKKGTSFQQFKKDYEKLKPFYKGLTIDQIIKDLSDQTVIEENETINKLNELFNHHYEIE